MYGQSVTYCEAVERAGGVPCLIPLMADLENLRPLYDKLDGIIFAGGNDISPQMFGEKPYPTTKSTSDRRDALETKLMRWALHDHKPILGICRGMQLLNVVNGGTLYQDIPTDLPDASDHEISAHFKSFEHQGHTVRIKRDSKLAGIMKQDTMHTNSLHHQAVKRVAANFEAVAWTDDDVIEAIESQDSYFTIGVQCHPEALESKVAPELQKLFASFIVATAPKA